MKNFGKDFVWGVATSAYQIEGAHDKDGKGVSIWDTFSNAPGNVMNDENGNIACDHYHRFEEDINLLSELGVKAYRFSIAWTRILPDGKGEINQKGIDFYNKIIDLLLEKGITPWVTLYHWDLPQNLQDEYEGWLGRQIIQDFAYFADVCFQAFGDRVRHWITLNEPWVVAILGYGQAVFPPAITSNSAPYLAGHHLLLAHAEAVEIYRKKYQKQQGGIIGITNNCDWREPVDQKPENKEAAERALEFFLGWFADPVYFGNYPASMIDRVGDRLPSFTEEEKVKLKGSSDFFGLNHYTTMMVENDDHTMTREQNVYGNGGISEDQDVILHTDPAWDKTTMGWSIVPWGCRKLLLWINQRYGLVDIYITENGCSFDAEVEDGQSHDPGRVEFLKGYLEACDQAIGEGANLKGYFAWSFLDNFEWALGYSKRFGIVHVDYDTLVRTPKDSYYWYRDLIK